MGKINPDLKFESLDDITYGDIEEAVRCFKNYSSSTVTNFSYTLAYVIHTHELTSEWKIKYHNVALPSVHFDDSNAFLTGIAAKEWREFYNAEPLIWLSRRATPIEIIKHRILLNQQ